MAGPDYASPPSLEAIEKIKNLPGARVEFREKCNCLVIDVEDEERWQQAIEVLKPIFGETIFREYERKLGEFDPADPEHQERLQYQCEVSLEKISQLLVLLVEGQPAGFLAVENYRGSGVVRDIIIKGAYRGRGRAKELYGLLFEEGKLENIIGYSKSPKAINARQAAGEDHGYTTYFGNQKGGLRGDRMTSSQQKVVDYLTAQDLLAPDNDKMPAGYVCLKGDQEILPANLVEVPSARTSRLGEPLRRLNELQEEIIQASREKNAGKSRQDRALPDSVAGILVSFKKTV